MQSMFNTGIPLCIVLFEPIGFGELLDAGNVLMRAPTGAFGVVVIDIFPRAIRAESRQINLDILPVKRIPPPEFFDY